MRPVSAYPELHALAGEIIAYGGSELAMQLPEVRFFVLDAIEFASLLEKNVYPTSPANIWEGKRIAGKRQRIEEGIE